MRLAAKGSFRSIIAAAIEPCKIFSRDTTSSLRALGRWLYVEC